jgi:hypothetical protein
MPTRPESPAADTARREAEGWADLADGIDAAGLGTVTEHAVIPEFDPADDLARRARRWSYELPDHGLAHLCRLAAGLADVEAAAWADRDPIIATRAAEDRRFLFGDRIVHWAVPVLVAADSDVSILLTLGDRMRPAPAESVGEGLLLPGHDIYGPADEPTPLDARLASLWGGWPPGHTRDGDPVAHYARAAATWAGLATTHPGTEAMWTALAVRARKTKELASGQ